MRRRQFIATITVAVRCFHAAHVQRRKSHVWYLWGAGPSAAELPSGAVGKAFVEGSGHLAIAKERIFILSGGLQKETTNGFRRSIGTWHRTMLIARERPDALLVTPTGSSFAHRKLIVEFAAAYRLPTIYHTREFADAGGLISYGTSIRESWVRAAGQVDRILRGEKPSEMPIEQLTIFELVINLKIKTAKALGLTVPATLLAQADEVIE